MKLMKKNLLAISLLLTTGVVFAQGNRIVNIEGVDILLEFYGHKVSHDGMQLIGEDENGELVYYNNSTKTIYEYPGCSYGQGYVIADNGWVVGNRMVDSNSQTNEGVIMAAGKIIVPPMFKNYPTSNIHSITPDATRICGVVGNPGRGLMDMPYYCDIDADGNIGEIQLLPTPPEDFFGSLPQRVTATWMSKDGKTIAGQVVQSRGILAYPILYHQNEQGIWNYSLPSEPLFNQAGIPLPKPVGDIEEEFPDVVYPEIENYIDPDKLAKWEADILAWQASGSGEANSPYNNLGLYMSQAKVEQYLMDAARYNEAFLEYDEMNMKYWEDMAKIERSSVFFGRNMMAMSADGTWLASSQEVEDMSKFDPMDPESITMNYIPYLFNLETGENIRLGETGDNLVTNQVLPNGDVIATTPAAAIVPACSYFFLKDQGRMLSVVEYLEEVKPEYAAWLEENLSSDLPVGIDPNGNYIMGHLVITGLVSASEDLSVIYGGVEGYAVGLNQLITYIMPGLPASGIEQVEAELPDDGMIRVYNLQGVKMMETKEISNLRNLAKGLYIINGKKVVL